MTLTRFLQTGRGEIWWRLEIVGLPVIWTSRAEDVGAYGDGRTRVHGLRVDGATLAERLDLSSGRLEGEAISVTIQDLGGRATLEFTREPEHRAWLTSTITETATTIGVLTTAGWPSSGNLFVGEEAISYTGLTATSFTGCTRGIWGSVATQHYVLDGRRSEITSRPTTIEGRVAILHLRGAPFWRGVVRTEPSYSAGLWRISIDPLSSLLEMDCGSDLAETTMIGIVYHRGAPLMIDLRRDSDPVDTWTSAVRIPAGTAEYAFFPTQDALVAEINSQIVAATSAWTQRIRAVVRSDGRWALSVVHPSGTVTPVRTRIRAPGHDLRFAQTTAGAESQWSRESPVGGASTQNTAGTYWHLVDGEEDPQLGLPPRGGTAEELAREVVALSVEPVVGETLNFYRGERRQAQGRVEAVLAPGIVAVQLLGSRLQWWGTGGNALTIEREYTPVSSGDVGALLSAIISQVPKAAPLGHVPLLRSEDFATSAFTLAVAHEPLARPRHYSWRERVALGEVLAAELLLAGAVMTIDSLGRISAVRLRLAAVSEAWLPEVTFVGTWPRYEGSAHGRWGAVEIQEEAWRYGPDTTPRRWIVRDVTAMSRSPFARTLQIRLRSLRLGTIEYGEVVQAASRLLGLLGGPYRVVTAEAPISQWYALAVGSAVRVTSAYVPGNGVMGITAEAGIVIERALEIDEARIQCAILLLGEVLGYHVGARINTQTNMGDNSWTITLLTDTADIAGPTAHLEFGDRIVIRQWDTASPVEVSGSVLSVVDSTSLKVALDSTWTPGTNIWILRAVRANASPQPSELHRSRYVHVADSTARIPYTTPANARKIVP